jgi:hypothetical protein
VPSPVPETKASLRTSVVIDGAFPCKEICGAKAFEVEIKRPPRMSRVDWTNRVVAGRVRPSRKTFGVSNGMLATGKRRYFGKRVNCAESRLPEHSALNY